MQFSRRWWLASKSIHHQWNMTGVTKNRYPGKEKLEVLMSLLICAFLIAVVGVNWCRCHFWSGGAVLSASHFQRAWHPESHSMFASNLLSTCHVWEYSSWSPLVNTAWQFLPVRKLHTLAKILLRFSYPQLRVAGSGNTFAAVWSCAITSLVPKAIFSLEGSCSVPLSACSREQLPLINVFTGLNETEVIWGCFFKSRTSLWF